MPEGLSSAELRELYERYAPVVHRRALVLLGHEADAWDAVQEVFERMLEAGSSFRREARPMTYVYRATTNVCLNKLRAQATRRDHQSAPEGDPPADAPEQAESRELLRALAAQLDDRALRIAALHFVDELTQEEIAEILELSRKTIGRELARIRELAAALAGRAETGGAP